MFSETANGRRDAGRTALPGLLLVVAAVLGAYLLGRGYFDRGRRVLDPGAAPLPVQARGDLAEDEKLTIDIFARNSASVVHITNIARRRRFGSINPIEVPEGTGTGFLWNTDGYIVTNHHVVQGGATWEVTLADNSTHTATFVGSAPDRDLAVLKLPDDAAARAKPVTLGTSRDLRVGQKVFAIGNPFGLDQTLTTGIISGLDREINAPDGRPIRGVIQTDAAINPGNSGGPLLDSAGLLIGVNTAIVSPSGAYAGIGFSIPVDTVNRIVPQLIRRGSAARAGLGVRLAPDPAVKQLVGNRALDRPGALIVDIEANSAAASAGLRPTTERQNGGYELGDLIVAVDDQKIRDSSDLSAALGDHSPGDEVSLRILRDGKEQTVSLKLQAIR